MLKASALYMVIVIALVMAVLCSSLITAAYFYRAQYQRTFRNSNLHHNLSSGINILLESTEDFSSGRTFSLFGGTNDTIQLHRQPWGFIDIGVVKAFVQQDTLTKVFTMAHPIDSTKWAALYVIDEDRSLSISGKTLIRGDAYLPKAGIREAYVNNQAYQGDKRLVVGLKHNSSKTLPVLNAERLNILQALWKLRATDSSLISADSLHCSFLKPVKVIDMGKRLVRIQNQHLIGQLIIRSDTTVIIESSSTLQQVIVLAPSIVVQQGFHGSCQLLATDSIRIDKDCKLSYPSCIGIVNTQSHSTITAQLPPKITVGENTVVNGPLFIYQQTVNRDVPPLIDLGKHAVVNGQVYVPGLLNYQESATINGSVFVNRFLYQTDYTRYENYLINIEINSTALSPYYLTSGLLPVAAKPQKVLQWLE
jgi:hypothetical protein